MPLLGRDVTIIGPENTAFLLESFQGREALGTPYRYDLTLLSEDPKIPVDKVLGQSMAVEIKPDRGEPRYFHGIVTYFAKLGFSMHHMRYAAVLSPRLSLLGYAHDCRVFNDASNFEPDPEGKQSTQNGVKIAKQVLSDLDVEVKDCVNADHVYRDRRYCVQYRETDLNFVQRLLEEEGIYYYFKHGKEGHTMVLADSISDHSPVEGYESVLYLPKERKQTLEGEHFWELTVSGALHSGKYSVLRGYDHSKPRPQQPQIEDKPTGQKEPGLRFEDYDYPTGLFEKVQAQDEAEVRMQSGQASNTLVEVEGNTLGVGTGHLVKLRRSMFDQGYTPFWADGDFDQQYLVTGATYSLSINQHEAGDTIEADQPFRARYTLLDSKTQFRPHRTAVKPRIEGPQTAIVVGPSGDEIYTDQFGRVKVQFDWDRKHERDQQSSCWVRVAQVWAGKQWGAMHIPRIGQEVIVEFLDGDPDRPIITGRVYNKDCMPPYSLPDNKTQSGIKSRSSKGGTDQNFNEIRFEDLKGKEELHIQAELDMSTNVKRNQTLYVGGDQNVTIHGNQTVSVHGTDEKTGKKLPVQSVTKVTGKHTFDASDTIKIQAPTSITLECGGSTIVMEPGKITMTAGGGAKVVLDANALTQANGGGKTLHDANVFHQASGGAKILLDGNVQAKSSGGSTVVLDGSATVKGASTATVEGSTEATLTAAGSTVKTSGPGVDATGPQVNVTGSGGVSITGAVVKVNS